MNKCVVITDSEEDGKGGKEVYFVLKVVSA